MTTEMVLGVVGVILGTLLTVVGVLVQRVVFAKLDEVDKLKERLSEHELKDATVHGTLVTRDYLDGALEKVRKEVSDLKDMVQALRLEDSGRHRVLGGGGQ